MKKFIKKFVLFLLCICISSGAFLLFFFKIISPQYDKHYQASIIDKVERLESIDSPKIILVGNSNLAYGIDSEMIQNELGMPVVNLGLHGELGNAFHENMAKLNIGEGDIVVVSHISYSDEGGLSNPELTWMTIENHTNLWRIVPAKDWPTLLIGLPSYILKASYYWITNEVENTVTDHNQRSMFNEYGDNIYPRDELTYRFVDGTVDLPEINEICINRLNEFDSFCKEKGASLVIAAYPIADCEFTPDKEEYTRFQTKLDEELDCEIISDFTDYFIPAELFYNTPYHLSNEGAEIRTKQLISDLKQYVEERK